jgi:hypothetical protein
MMRVAMFLAFGLALNTTVAAASSQIQAAERVFDLLPPASHLKQLYGDNTVFPRPASDVFYNTYRTTFVEALAAKYSAAALEKFADTLSESETIEVQLLKELNQPVAISLQRAVEKIAATQRLESSVDVNSTDKPLKNGVQE